MGRDSSLINLRAVRVRSSSALTQTTTPNRKLLLTDPVFSQLSNANRHCILGLRTQLEWLSIRKKE